MPSPNRAPGSKDHDPLQAARQVAWGQLWRILLAPPKETAVVDTAPEADPLITRAGG